MLVKMSGGPVASLGALITVLSLAFDPFVQQVLTSPDRWVSQRAATAETRTTRAFLDDVLYSDDWLTAIDAGLNETAAQFAPSATCTTGTCNWAPFPTLGWCSSCVDASFIRNTISV